MKFSMYHISPGGGGGGGGWVLQKIRQGCWGYLFGLKFEKLLFVWVLKMIAIFLGGLKK